MTNPFAKLIGRHLALTAAGAPMFALEPEEGQTLTEYALILAFVALVAVAALVFFGSDITGFFSSAGNGI
jgi:pilus assembly protein Flp/PilA